MAEVPFFLRGEGRKLGVDLDWRWTRPVQRLDCEHLEIRKLLLFYLPVVKYTSCIPSGSQ